MYSQVVTLNYEKLIRCSIGIFCDTKKSKTGCYVCSELFKKRELVIHIVYRHFPSISCGLHRKVKVLLASSQRLYRYLSICIAVEESHRCARE